MGFQISVLRRFFFLVMITLGVKANNSLNLQLPSPYNNYSYDEVRTTDNMSCKNAIGGSINFEMGMTGIVNNASNIFESNADETKDVGLYARINIPLNAPKERINCNTLYKLELHKKRLEVMKLEAELKKLKDLQFINNDKKD